jgi:hypothetical protein
MAAVVCFVLLAVNVSAYRQPVALAAQASAPAAPGVVGPTVIGPFAPAVFNGSLLDLPQLDEVDQPGQNQPAPGVPFKGLPGVLPGELDPLAQTLAGAGQMPDPIANFAGIYRGELNSWIPPDTNGDVGPVYYIQNVNIGIGIFRKSDGFAEVKISFDALFDGTGTPCDTQNRGDPIVLYDPMADRWLISDFSLPAGGPYLECIAISQSGDPVSGGWYFYALDAGNPNGAWHDYPKLSVWPDAYYMSANMFDPWSGAKVWALDRAAMLAGLPLTAVTFDAGTAYGSLLPSNLRGPLPPAGSPAYFASISFPDTLQIWEFHVDWLIPGNSTFTGPVNVTVAPFGYIGDIPQPAPGALLDSLGDRLMMQFQYRNFGTHESLWVNHTVPSGDSAGVRWYELRLPGGTPTLYQQGTFQPDNHYRWMGSLAVDQDGNMALGYSVASETLMPAIRYAGRLNGEMLGALPQSETSLIESTGVQVGASRWGDYSAMSVDPLDDCTFWYTTEYYIANGAIWQTRIGSFRFPSCGQPKGTLSGTVYDAVSGVPIPDALVVADGLTTTMTVEADGNGIYTMLLPGGVYTLTAGPVLPGYPDPTVVTGVQVVANSSQTEDIPLVPQPALVEDSWLVDDNVAGGNNNGFPEPGESGLLLWETVLNAGAITATNVTAHLTALTPGVTVDVADASYPDIAVGETQENQTAFVFSVAPTITCGTDLDFWTVFTADEGVFTVSLTIPAGVPGPRTAFFSDDMESGVGQWITGGTNNTWGQTTALSHSPTHSWTDSPAGNYQDNTSSWLSSPTFDLSAARGFELSFWHQYDTEDGWDFIYVEYSLDGGATWEPELGSYTGLLSTWTQETFAVPMFDDQSNVAFRFLLVSDGSVTEDGWYIDDVDLSYIPYGCSYPVEAPGVPVLIEPLSGTITTTQQITLSWEAGAGGLPDGYNLELDGVVYTTTATMTSTWFDLGVHTWRVRAFNILGYSEYSDAWMFEVVAAPGVPVLIEPLSGTITTTQQLTLAWQTGTRLAARWL